MTTPDFNLLLTLDALLAEGSVARAARRLKLSPSAMSRALARLRAVTGDPLLVRAGRGLVPTPRALELRERVSELVSGAEEVLRPASQLDLPSLSRTFAIRSSDGFVENVGAALVMRVAADAPGARLRFLQKTDKDSAGLREGTVDLETGVVGSETGLEVRTRALFDDCFVGVVRAGHPLTDGPVTAERYAAGRHVLVSRRGGEEGLMDRHLQRLGLERTIHATVGGFGAALALARGTDLIATVPDRHTSQLRAGMHSFALPFDADAITVSMLWHPRMDGDLAHRWLRSCVREVCSAGQNV
ncbi:MAG TPA: LysR family transcriptional regulator [Telluria sp.]|nr:LysR family transcriptional regulator [Telluria sp.]